MKKSTKTLMMVSMVVLAAAVLACIGSVLSFAAGGYEHAEQYTAGNAEIAGEVRHLAVDWVNGRVILACHAESTVLLSETSNKPLNDDNRLQWWLDGDTLRVHYARPRIRLGSWNQQKELTITLPEGMVLESAAISATSAELEIPSLSAGELRLTTTSGDIRAAVSAGTIHTASTSGGLSLTAAGSAQKIHASSTSGNLQIEAGDADAIEAETTSGSISVSAGSVGTLRLTSTSGTASVKAASLTDAKLSATSGNLHVTTAALGSLEAGTTSGSITAALPAEPGFTAEVRTLSGRFSHGLSLTGDGSGYVCGDGSGRVKLAATSGDIRLDAAE